MDTELLHNCVIIIVGINSGHTVYTSIDNNNNFKLKVIKKKVAFNFLVIVKGALF